LKSLLDYRQILSGASLSEPEEGHEQLKRRPDRVALADGLTHFEAYRIEGFILIASWASFVSGVILVVVWQVFDAVGLAIFGGVIASLGASSLTFSNFFFSPQKIAQKESENGYTTFARGRDPQVPLVLPRSGIIVRNRGEAEFPWREFNRLALAEIRAARSNRRNEQRNTAHSETGGSNPRPGP
jgi:hypothetical protein